MPSLKVDYCDYASNDTFHKYLCIDITNEENTNECNASHIAISFMKFLVRFIAVVNTLFIPYYFIQWLFSHYNTWYNDNQIYYFDDVYHWIVQLCACIMFIYCFGVLINSINIWIIVLFSSIFNIIIGGTLMVLDVHYFATTKFLQKEMINIDCNTYFRCVEWTNGVTYMYLVYPLLFPLLTIFSYLCYQHMFIIKSVNKQWDKLLQIDPLINVRNQSYHLLSIYILFLIIWGIFAFGWHLIFTLNFSYIMDNHEKQFEYLFYFLLFWNSCFKYLLKKVARKIDQRRSLDRLKMSHRVSLEIFIEFNMSAMYYWLYRYIIIHNLSNESFSKFALISFYHIMSEVIQSVKIMPFYYRITKDIINKSSKLRYWYNDKSTLYHWRVRKSIDIVIRLIPSMTLGIVMIIYYLLYPPHYYVKNIWKAELFNFLSIIIDLIWFLILVLFHQIHSKFSLLRPFVILSENLGPCIFWLFVFYALFATALF